MNPGRDTLIERALARRNVTALFAALPLLKELDQAQLAEITREVEWFSLPAGNALYTAGQPADGLYVVVNGALGLYVAHPTGGSRLCATITPGETVGESEVLSGRPRGATAITLRDTELARIPTSTFESLAATNASVLREVARIVVRRLDAVQRAESERPAAPRTFALLPADGAVDPTRFGRLLLACLEGYGRSELITSGQAKDRTSHWFHRVEQANTHVVYVGDAEPTGWSRLCTGHAECTLVLAHADTDPLTWRTARQAWIHQPQAAHRPMELILLGNPAHNARELLDGGDFQRHHHVRSPADVARVARLITGRGVGIVLSGGGARGMAHLGVLRALSAAKFPIDAIGGASVGAIIGAAWAADWGLRQVVERMRRSFVDSNPLGDYTFPIVSLSAGRRVNRLLRREFADLQIEDLRLPFFCVSANLTAGQLTVHQRGSLWLWLRASIAIPGVLPPVITRGAVHVDGATLNNLPVDVMREMIKGTIVAVDVGADRTLQSEMELTEMPSLWGIPRWLHRNRRRVNVLQILLRSGMINSMATTTAQRELADVVIKPPLENIDLLDWHAFDRMIECGYRHASQNMPQYWATLTRNTGERP